MRILLALQNMYTDVASGAAWTTRLRLEWLREAGHPCRVLATTCFDLPPRQPLADHLAGLGVPLDPCPLPLLHFDLDAIPVTLVTTGSWQAASLSADERALYRAQLARLLDEFAPDLLMCNGWHPLILEALHAARGRGVRTLYTLHNHGYEDPLWFRDVDHVLCSSAWLSEQYRRSIGLASDGLDAPLRWRAVVADDPEPTFVTFVNPLPHKGLALFLRVAHVLAGTRPDIPLLVVESAGSLDSLREWEGEVNLRQLTNVSVGPATRNPADFFALSRLLLIPSIFQEPTGRVAVEAMANGIPPLVSDRGALPETVKGSGRVLPLPAWMIAGDHFTTEGRGPRLPTPGEVTPWIDAITCLWDDTREYAAASARARQAATLWYSEARQRRLLLEYFSRLAVAPRATAGPVAVPAPDSQGRGPPPNQE